METKARKSWLSTALANPVRALKESSYNPRVLALVRGLHLSNILRKWYQWATGGKHNILRVNLGRFDVLFHVHSAGEYRVLEHYFVSYERDFADVLLSSLAEGDVFLDVGSSVGQFTVPMAKVVGESGLVLAVEPEASACAQLEANLRLNGLSNVRIFTFALGDECGEGRLSWKDGSCPSLLQVSTQDRESVSTTAPSATCGLEQVSVEVGDQLMDRERLPIPKAVKIDVEGYEFQVIRGLSRTLRNASCRLLCCEIHPAFLPSGTSSQSIIEEVKSLGFAHMVLNERSGQIHMVARKDQSQA
jgi:FkbM family methyltransferase